jgi:hypothetical protein
MSNITFEAFEADALAQGFDEVATRQYPVAQTVAEHTHTFSVKALIVQGEMWLTVGGSTRHLLPGDIFELTHGTPHAERYGDEGATYWAARRNAVATTAA